MKLTKNKAMYTPGETVSICLSTKSDAIPLTDGKFEMTIYHLEEIVQIKKGTWNQSMIEIQWQTPSIDFQGYLVKVILYNEKNQEVAQETIGVDISSSWTKFPRYGFLTDFSTGTDTKKIIDQMKNWQLNGIEYYDWKFLHHQLLPLDGAMTWQDWSGRFIDGNIVKDYITQAKKMGMVNMSYNMIYAATNNFADYGIDDRWGLWYAKNQGEDKKQGDRFTFQMGKSPSGQSDLYFFDIENEDWQDYIIKKNKEAIESMGFDGWHGDTVGEWGEMWTFDKKNTSAEGKLVKDGYTTFLNKAKHKLGDYYLSFNPVGAQGIENVNSSDVDVLYAEIWPWDFDSEDNQYNTYLSLKLEIDQSRKESGGKSLIIPAYMEYDYAQSVESEPFNLAAVMLTDAVVYAAGGSRIELGDGNQMLSNEYFPSHHLYMTEEHLFRQHALQNFIVAYENLLRDGLEDNGHVIEIKHQEVSDKGEANKVWAYSKESESYETIQFINLVGISTNDWRANEGKKETPNIQSDLVVTYYTDTTVDSAWITSPDPFYQGLSINLEMEKGQDEKGSFIRVVMPTLEYWNMVYLKK